MDKLENCPLPPKANHCTAARCRSCGWDADVLAARNKLMATKGLTLCGGIEYLALPGKEDADEETE